MVRWRGSLLLPVRWRGKSPVDGAVEGEALLPMVRWRKKNPPAHGAVEGGVSFRRCGGGGSFLPMVRWWTKPPAAGGGNASLRGVGM